ncbi:carboxypeptidase regulatory-like domain-containing protein [Asanoa sp. NPDC049573]|uniref:carboxypeptidase regulatory-like domain-containing protein n=1 Tax=Asanoa sp. NPDC049573 TaxID=3155396 RepID=UPI0034375D22
MRRVRATAALAAAVLAGTVAVWATPAQAAGTGVVAGRITTSDGAPAADIWVAVMDYEEWGDAVGYTTTAADGTYRITGLDTDSYVLSMSGIDVPTQYFDGKTDISEADEVRVTSGQTTTINQQLVATGVLTGRIRQANGEPYAWSYVSIAPVDGGLSSYYGSTDDNGDYRAAVPPGTYYVSFSPIEDSYQQQYIPGQLTSDNATRFTVAAGQEVRADDTVLATGSVSGRLTNDNGTPVTEASVRASVFQAYGDSTEARTNANGEFSIPKLLVGDYMIEFYVGNRVQFFDGTTVFEEADRVTVTAGNDTRVTESMLPTGNVRVRALDAITGATIRDFCAGDVCSDGTGQVLLTDQVAGPQLISIWPSGNYLSRESTVTVLADKTIDMTVRLAPGAKITTTVIDKATGKALADVCVFAYKPGQVYIPDGWGDDQCSDATGKATVDRLAAGDYRLFAMPRNKVYGRQWVTADGGSGDERQAVTIKATVGRTASAPQVKIDRAGSIRGRVTDASTGAPLEARIAPFTSNPGSGNGEAATDANGNYQIDGLGPYRWPLNFGSFGYATAWTGGAASRYTATGTQVTSGATATADLAMTHGVPVTGKVVVESGTLGEWGRINVLNTATGDYTGTVDFQGDTYELHVLPAQEIRYAYDLDVDGQNRSSDKAKLSPATPGGPVRYSVTVPADGLTVDVLVD